MYAQRLTICFVNEHWKAIHPHFQLEYGPLISSDHSPGILTIIKGINFGLKSFKFMKEWLQHPNYKPITKNSWEELVTGNPQIRLVKKLKRLKDPLRLLNKEKYENIMIRVEEARNLLEIAQTKLIQALLNPNTQMEMKTARENYLRFLAFEESFLKEKSRIKWL